MPMSHGGGGKEEGGVFGIDELKEASIRHSELSHMPFAGFGGENLQHGS